MLTIVFEPFATIIKTIDWHIYIYNYIYNIYIYIYTNACIYIYNIHIDCVFLQISMCPISSRFAEASAVRARMRRGRSLDTSCAPTHGRLSGVQPCRKGYDISYGSIMFSYVQPFWKTHVLYVNKHLWLKFKKDWNYLKKGPAKKIGRWTC